VTTYVLKSPRHDDAFVTTPHSRGPKVFDSKLQALWFKAKFWKWHWQIIDYTTLQDTTAQPAARPCSDRKPVRDLQALPLHVPDYGTTATTSRNAA
jgi:hypothetical protein